MNKQIQASPSNKKISEIYKRVKEGSFILQPDFQRKFVWNNSHKESFIDTILKGLPFPEIYIAQSGVDIEKIESQEVVVDGQQRLSTIIHYIDEPEQSKEFGKIVSKYRQLNSDEQKAFLNYNVVVRDLGDVTPEEIREIFKRINQTKYSLEQIEIQNAIYDGEFITTAKEILEHIDATHMPIFTDSEMTRMSDLHFVLLLMSTIENGGYFFRDSEIEKMIIQFNDEYPNKQNIKNQLIEVLNRIKDYGFEADSIWYRKSNFFTLVIELVKGAYENVENLREKLVKFEELIYENKSLPKQSNPYSLYYSYSYTGTNTRQARVMRGEILSDHLLNLIGN